MTETAANNALLEDIERRQDEVLCELDALNSQIKQVLKQHIAAPEKTIEPVTAESPVAAENPVAPSGPAATNSATAEPVAEPATAILRITHIPLPVAENTALVVNDR